MEQTVSFPIFSQIPSTLIKLLIFLFHSNQNPSYRRQIHWFQWDATYSRLISNRHENNDSHDDADNKSSDVLDDNNFTINRTLTKTQWISATLNIEDNTSKTIRSIRKYIIMRWPGIQTHTHSGGRKRGGDTTTGPPHRCGGPDACHTHAATPSHQRDRPRGRPNLGLPPSGARSPCGRGQTKT